MQIRDIEIMVINDELTQTEFKRLINKLKNDTRINEDRR